MEKIARTDEKAAEPRLLNLGCGQCKRSGWINIDFQSSSPDVLAYDLRLGIPFADATFDIVYHSHVLEHFSRAQGAFFIKECFRVLKPGGLLRVVVPDLENITRAYIAALDTALDHPKDEDALEKHAWMQIELLDQMTRSASGGEMLAWWRQDPIPQKEFILCRLGEEARRGMHATSKASPKALAMRRPALDVASPEFIFSGELHRWMYDRVSLAAELKKAGFASICRQNYTTSQDMSLSAYALDSDEQGNIRKPDSLFMEACKPKETSQGCPRIALFCSADSGGAGIAASRLQSTLREQGANSELYVLRESFLQTGVHVLPCYGQQVNSNNAPSSFAVSTAGFASDAQRHRALAKYQHRPAGGEYYSVPTQCCNFNDVPLLDTFDVINLHWVAGMTDPAHALEFFSKRPVVWTLHDMNPFTGGCHYADGCRGFEKHCGNCPQLGSQNPGDLSHQTWKLRMSAYRQLNMHIVAPSQWLAALARNSSLFSRFPIHVIPNGHPLDVYTPLNRDDIRAALGFAPDTLVLLFASQNLTNRRKGGGYLLQLLHWLAQSPLKNKVAVLLLGNNPDRAFMETGIRVELTGHVSNDHHMAALYNAADAVLVPSFEDNQPNVICEAMACGTPVVAFSTGGIPEMVIHGITGYLSAAGDIEGLKEGIIWAEAQCPLPQRRRICRAHAMEKWNPEQCARLYAGLYASLLTEKMP